MEVSVEISQTKQLSFAFQTGEVTIISLGRIDNKLHKGFSLFFFISWSYVL